MMIVFLVLLFFLGAAVGSFLNVLVYRTVEGTDWVRGKSRCDHCKKPLLWFEMVPILSYVIFRGKSRCCKRSLSLQHPLVETLTGMLFLWWYLMGSVFFQLVSSPLRTAQYGYWLLVGIILLVVLVADFVYGIVPTIPVCVGVVASVFYRLLIFWYGPLTGRDLGGYLLSALGAFVFFYFLHMITRGKGMGMGDVILAPLLGLILGFPRILVGLVLAFWLGALAGVGMIALRRKRFGQTIPFAPFMIVGSLVALLWGNFLWEKLVLGGFSF